MFIHLNDAFAELLEVGTCIPQSCNSCLAHGCPTAGASPAKG